MSTTTYLIAGVAIAGLITLGLRTLPFAALKPLRTSRFVTAIGRWMPAGILLILAVVVLRDQFVDSGTHWWAVLVATAVTVGVHLAAGRRALLSIAAGTASYVALINLL